MKAIKLKENKTGLVKSADGADNNLADKITSLVKSAVKLVTENSKPEEAALLNQSLVSKTYMLYTEGSVSKDQARDFLFKLPLVSDCLIDQLTLLKESLVTLAAKGLKKYEPAAKLTMHSLSKLLLNQDEAFYKQKETMKVLFGLTSELLCLMHPKPKQDNDDSVVIDAVPDDIRSEGSDPTSKASEGKTPSQELLSLLQNSEKKGGLIKDMIAKLKAKEPERFRQLSIAIRLAQNHFFTRFIRELNKQSLLAGNTLQRSTTKANH